MKNLWIVGLFVVFCLILYSRISESVMSADASSTQVLATLYSQSHPQSLAAFPQKTDNKRTADSFSSGKSAVAPVLAQADRLTDYVYLHHTRLESPPMPDAPAAASLMSQKQTPPL
jgi:hypothetical protein